MKLQEIQSQVTVKIINVLKSGDISKWRRPWTLGCEAMNLATQRKYKGALNIFLLGCAQLENDYETALWVSYKQIQELKGKDGSNGTVNVGEKASRIYFCSKVEKINKESGEESAYWVHRLYPVFNLAQTNLDQEKYKALAFGNRTPIPESKLEQRLLSLGIPVRFAGNQAYFSSAENSIRLPSRDQFHSRASLLSVLLHELVHSTGLPLERESLLKYHDDVTHRATEEMITEISCTMLCAALGIEQEVDENHICYISSWLKALDNDHSLIFAASKEASKAAEYLLDRIEATSEVPRTGT